MSVKVFYVTTEKQTSALQGETEKKDSMLQEYHSASKPHDLSNESCVNNKVMLYGRQASVLLMNTNRLV